MALRLALFVIKAYFDVPHYTPQAPIRSSAMLLRLCRIIVTLFLGLQLLLIAGCKGDGSLLPEPPTCDQPSGALAQTSPERPCVFEYGSIRYSLSLTTVTMPGKGIEYVANFNDSILRGGLNSSKEIYPFILEITSIDGDPRGYGETTTRLPRVRVRKR